MAVMPITDGRICDRYQKNSLSVFSYYVIIQQNCFVSLNFVIVTRFIIVAFVRWYITTDKICSLYYQHLVGLDYDRTPLHIRSYIIIYIAIRVSTIISRGIVRHVLYCWNRYIHNFHWVICVLWCVCKT